MAEKQTDQKLSLFSDSDDDDENVPLLQYATNNMEDMCNEAVLLKHWGVAHLNNAELQSFFGKLSGSSTKTKAVQTQPDSSGVPPSWIVTGQNMANELYVGINNLLNSTFHPPRENLQLITKAADETGGRIDEQKKPLPDESVRPKTTSHPILRRQLGFGRGGKINTDVRMPPGAIWNPKDFFFDARLPPARMDQSTLPNLEEFRRELKKLRDTADRLRTLTVYLKEDWNSLKLDANDARTLKIVRNKYQQTEPEMVERKSASQRKKNTEYDFALSDISEEFSDLELTASNDGNDPVHEKGSVKKPSRDSMKSQKPTSSRVTFRTGNVKYIPGVYVSRYKIPSRKDSPKSGQKSLVDVRKDRAVEKVESSIQPKATASSSGSKNFIKKNILALRTPSDRSRSKKIDKNKESTSSSPNSDSSVTSSQTKKKGSSDM